MKDSNIKNRLTVLILFIMLLMLLLLGRLVYLQIIQGDRYFNIAETSIIRTTYIPAPRGMITDRRGRVLARDVPGLNVCAIPSEIDDINIFCKTLSPLIGYTPERIRSILESKGINPYQKITIKAKVETETMMQVAEVRSDIPGLYLEVQPMREYPRGETASHVIGYVGEITSEELETYGAKGYRLGDYIGKDGVEKHFDSILRGEPGIRRAVVDVSGRVIGTILEKKPRPGRNIVLTIDFQLQQDIEKILQWHVTSLSATSRENLAAAALMEDVNTGEILAMASIPQFDPNLFSRGISKKDYDALISRDDYPLLNRAVSGQYPLASTYKMITAAAALQEGIITRYTPFNCPGYYMVKEHRFNCFVRTGHGKIDFNESMSESCDVAFYFMGEKLGIDRLLKYSRYFGMGEKTGIELPGETPGVLPDKHWKKRHFNQPWFTGDTVNLSIGQGYLGATPLQLIAATSTVATDGKFLKPTLLKAITDSDGKLVSSSTPRLVRQVPVDASHFEAIREGMRTATRKGTARRLKAPISFAGKTGTAENFPCPENPHGRNHAWFCGFAPAYSPEISLVVFFERSGGYGGDRAVPIASEILRAYYDSYQSKYL